MSNQRKPIIRSCPYCGKENKISFLNRNYFPIINGKRRLFCNENCYERYKEQFFVEEYHGNKIYKFILDNKPFYVPYFYANYGFYNLEDCRKRINSKSAIVDLNVYRVMMNYQFKTEPKE